MKLVERDEYPTQHTFTSGLYTRQVSLPKGHIVVEHKHKHKTLNILASGSLELPDLDTKKITILTAPMTFESDAGSRKVAFILEDVVWINVHVTEETDLEVLEDMYVDNDTTDLIKYKETLWVG